MNLIDLLQMTKPQSARQSEGLAPIMQFLAQNKAPQMPTIQMPQTHDYGQQIMAHGLQKQDREDTYAAHLKAKNDMEQQQAIAIRGHEAELSDDPQIQALLKLGNPQLVNYAMKLAEDEKQQQIKAQYNENATFAMYDKLIQEGTPESLAKAARILEFKKAGGTNINVGDKFTDVGRKPLTTEQLVEAGMPPGTVAFYDKDGIPKPIDINNTEAESKAALHAAALDTALSGYMSVLDKVTDSSDLAKNSLLSDIHSLNIPGVSNLALHNMSPDFQELDSRRALMIQAIEKEFSGAAGTKKEDVDYAIGLVPNPHTAKSVQVATLQRLQETLQAMRVKAGTAYTKMQGTAGNYSNLITDEMRRDGFANIVGKVENPKMDPNAVSPAGAFGLAQTMPGTFKMMYPDGDPSNPAHQIEAGHRYWKQALQASNGDVKRAAAYYQGGPKGMEAFDKGIYRSDGNLNTKQYGDKAFGPSPGPQDNAGSKSAIAKQQRDYTAELKARALAAASKNSPVEKAKKEARIAALEERAKKLGIQ